MSLYKTGTVSVNNGQNTVTGNGTSFIDIANVQLGDLFTVDGSKFYEIYQVDTNTQIRIRNIVTGGNFAETTVTDGDYAIVRNFTSQTSAEIAAKVLAVQQKWQNREEEMTDWFYTSDNWADVTSINGDALTVMTPNGINNLLGTAATEDVTTSPTDSTSGRLIKVGDFGLSGATALAATAPNSNLSEVEETSIVRADNANDKPDTIVGSGSTAVNPGMVLHVNRYLNASAQSASQLCFGHDNGVNGGSAMWHRSVSGTSGPNPWKLVYDSDNLNTYTWTMGSGKQKYGVGRSSTTVQFEFDIVGLFEQPAGATFSGTVDIVDMEANTTIATNVALTYSTVSSDRIIVLEKTGLTGIGIGKVYRAVVTSTVSIEVDV